MTDANLLLGRLVPEYFPSIFGPNEDQILDLETVREQFATLIETIFADTGMRLGPEEVAHVLHKSPMNRCVDLFEH